MDESVMAGGFHPGSTVGIGDPDASTHHRHRNHNPHPTPTAATYPHPHPHPHHTHPMLEVMPSGGFFETAASQRGTTMNPLMGRVISPSAAAAATATATSDDDEDPGDADDDGHDPGAGGGKAKKGSPWHRMKWTDGMVRMLIAIVAYVGDDGGPDAASDGAARRRPGAVLQKKGKWKAVSQLMLEKGCYVSPQQCEDKFNDLNKRYKRLNEILGRGTTCEVVENPALLDSMPHVPPKAKEDVRKILSSKHLFYQEMCAYHNGPRIPNSHDFEFLGTTAPNVASLKDGSGSKDEDFDEDEDDDDGEEEEEEEGSDEYGRRVCNSLWADINGVLQDKTKTCSEQREWIRGRALQLQEERVGIEAEALELETRRFKWQRFRSKKDREMERQRLDNERLMLENERMAMQVRQKELELGHGRSGEWAEPAGFRMDREQRRDLMELN